MAVVCTSALVAAPLLVPATATAQRAEAAAIQSITIRVAKQAITVKGAKGLDAGRIKVQVKGRGSAEIAMFDRGYDYRDFSKDAAAADKGNMKALKRALANTTILGGFQSGGSGTIVLPKAGEYTVFSFESRGHAVLTAGKGRTSPAPDVDGKIVGKTGPVWGGSNTLPAKGTFLFKNADKTVPHFVVLQQVVEGTTTDQVLAALTSGEEGPPPDFMLPAGMDTGSLSPGRKMTVNYDLPPGQYVIMCFFPDPNMQGMPHAFMGMLKMIHLGGGGSAAGTGDPSQGVPGTITSVARPGW
ncbi:hypothetical protein ASG88_11960 [Nocardioides sp. Soil777]|nr:hypothetical protein ASG88_11960 [Nocardioides sp. Soil777]